MSIPIIDIILRWFGRTPEKNTSPQSTAILSDTGTPESQSQLDSARTSLVVFDEHLLERSRNQWQFGEWTALAKVSRDAIEQHPDRAKIALLVAAAHQQLGAMSLAREFVALATNWGCSKKLVSQILISGVYNTLGRAAAIDRRQALAKNCFEEAIMLGTPGADLPLVGSARMSYQLKLLEETSDTNFGVNGAHKFIRFESDEDAVTTGKRIQKSRKHVTVEHGAIYDLGVAWAGNTINTVIFRHHGVLTCGDYQFTSFYINETKLRVVRRELLTGELSSFDMAGTYNLRDAHNSISLGYDRQGYIHISYDHHGSQLRYRRSLKPMEISGWTDELGMTSQHEEKVTYPCFIVAGNNHPLMLLYRDGRAGKGAARLKIYEEERQTWTDHSGPILSGADQRPWSSSPYWNHPAIGTDGSLHLSFVWRTHALGDEGRINNINVCYACSPDMGKTWRTSKGHEYLLPITQVNAETVYAVSPGSNLINQTSMALDSRNRPHIVFYSDDHDGVPQYQHVWFDGGQWRHQYISERKEKFLLAGREKGTLQIPISRPEIVIDSEDNVYVLYRGDLSDDKMVALSLMAPDYRFNPEQIHILWDMPLGWAEPVIDRVRWKKENVLSLLLQHNLQPDGDLHYEQAVAPVHLIDVRFAVQS